MNTLNRCFLPALFALAALLPACGGGSSQLETASLEGLVYELDGQTVDRSGVQVRVLETGASAVTAADGQFAFGALPPGTVTLAFGPTLSVQAHSSGEDGAEQEVEDEHGDEPGDDGLDDDEDEAEDGEDEDEAEDDENEDELDDDDDDGMQRLVQVAPGDEIRIRCSIRDGRIEEITVVRSDRRRARVSLTRAADSPDPDVEGKIEVESKLDGDELELEVEHLAPGTVIEVFMGNPDEGTPLTPIGLFSADSSGHVEFELETEDGDRLPLGASDVDALAGFAIEVRLAGTGAVLLTGEIPTLPAPFAEAPDGGAPAPGERGRGRARLFPHVAGLEGHVEIRTRPEKEEQRFKMEAEHLAPGTLVEFQIEDSSDPSGFSRIGSATAGGDGEAEIHTQDGLPFPLGVSDVSDLVGLEVRVVDGSGTLLLSGTVPELVAD